MQTRDANAVQLRHSKVWSAVLQERLTHELAGAVSALAGARGVLVVVEALHMCMVARGVEKHASRCGPMCNRQTWAVATFMQRRMPNKFTAARQTKSQQLSMQLSSNCCGCTSASCRCQLLGCYRSSACQSIVRRCRAYWSLRSVLVNPSGSATVQGLRTSLCCHLQHHHCGGTRQPGRGWRCTQPAAAQPVPQLTRRERAARRHMPRLGCHTHPVAAS